MSIHRTSLLAAVTAAVALGLPAAANASVTPALNGTTLTVTDDDQPDNIAIGDAGGFITVNGDPTTAPADGSIDLVVNAGGGDDTTSFTTASLKSVTIDGGPGDDLLNGSTLADIIHGGDGNDRIVAGKNPKTANDQMLGDAGNDVLVWNDGEGTDDMDGGAGADTIEVNGKATAAPDLNGNLTASDAFKVKPNGAGGVRFDRTNIGPFGLNITTSEKLQINGLSGDDRVDTDPGLAPLIALEENGGPGNDTLNGSDGADVLNGGDGNDTLDGGAGNDRISGDRGADTQIGGPGDDTLVWNNGDGSDKSDGGDGLDRIEVNGAGAGDAFTVAPNNGRVKFDRTNLVPFTVDIGSSEALDVNGLGGDDTFTAAPGTGSLIALDVDGGSGNDTITGAEGADTLAGGSGDDKVTGGGGADLLDGQDGNDALSARDGSADLVRGGAGTDSAQTDALVLDDVDAVEKLDALPAPDTKASALSVLSRTVTVKKGVARIRVAAPEALNGSLTLVTAEAVKIGGVKVRAVLGRASYSLNAGQTATLKVKVVKGLTRRTIKARAQSASQDAAGNVATANSAITLKPAKAKTKQ